MCLASFRTCAFSGKVFPRFLYSSQPGNMGPLFVAFLMHHKKYPSNSLSVSSNSLNFYKAAAPKCPKRLTLVGTWCNLSKTESTGLADPWNILLTCSTHSTAVHIWANIFTCLLKYALHAEKCTDLKHIAWQIITKWVHLCNHPQHQDISH